MDQRVIQDASIDTAKIYIGTIAAHEAAKLFDEQVCRGHAFPTNCRSRVLDDAQPEGAWRTRQDSSIRRDYPRDAADAMEIPSKTLTRVEKLIGDVEQAAMDLRAAVRGCGH